MMTGNDQEYYARREQQERARAECAEDDGARHAHLVMAERYSALLRSGSSAARA
jgi:hypothetical protein